jgi:cytosine/adenosine deaminase-related metal-dependent hydrolase
MAERTRIDARMIVAYQDGEHRLLEHGCVLGEGNTDIHVGRAFDGTVDRTVDARDRVLTPGFINTHAHLNGSPLDKSFVEDRGRRQFAMSGLPELLPALSSAMTPEANRACIDFAMGELLRTGTTTVMDLGGTVLDMRGSGDYIVEAVERAGLRAYVASGYRSGGKFTRDGKKMEYFWFDDGGVSGFERAVAFIEEVNGRAGDRIRGYLSPGSVDTCTEKLLRLSREASDRMQVPLALHASQAVFEFDEIVQRHGMTPVEWLEAIDFLSEWNILGHAIYLAGSSWVQFAGDDVGILARHGASIAHCPWVFARRGVAMESFPRYLAAGVNVCLGTDTCPLSMLHALRWAAVVGKIAARDSQQSTARDVFDAATLNGARMLHRDDLGRIAPGAKADILFWDATSTFMVPLRDPIKNIVFNAEAEDLREVMIDGQWVVRDNRPLHVDERRAARALQFAGERMWSEMGPGDWAHRGADELSPQSFRRFEG